MARSWTSSIAIWVEPTSVEWMVQVTRTMALPSATSASASAGERPSGWWRRRAISRRRGRFPWLASEVTTTTGISLPRVEVPATSIETRGEAASTSRRYSTTFGQGASLRSAPTSWPRKAAGGWISAAPAGAAAKSKRISAVRGMAAQCSVPPGRRGMAAGLLLF